MSHYVLVGAAMQMRYVLFTEHTRIGKVGAMQMVTVMFVYAHVLLDVQYDRRMMLSLSRAPIVLMVFVVMELHAHYVVRIQNLLFLYQIFVIAQVARTSQQRAVAWSVQQIRSGPQVARTSLRVSALPGGRKQAVSALRVWLANTKPTLGLLRVLRVQPRNIRMLSMHTRVQTVPLIQSL